MPGPTIIDSEVSRAATALRPGLAGQLQVVSTPSPSRNLPDALALADSDGIATASDVNLKLYSDNHDAQAVTGKNLKPRPQCRFCEYEGTVTQVSQVH